MADLKWSSDGQEMFDKIMAIVPEAMRDAVKPMLFGLLRNELLANRLLLTLFLPWCRTICPNPSVLELCRHWE